MRPKSLILLVLALGCGLAASIGISRVMDANANRPAMQLETTPIYVALHNINLGDPIGASMVALEEWPADKAPKGSLTSLEDLEGRRPRTTIVAGTPILEAQLLALGETADPVANIPDGFRLSTISVNAEKVAAGLLSPGDRVDVQLFMAASQRDNVPFATTRVILQNIRVFAIEQAVQRTAEGEEARAIPKTVSLLVTPEQASKLDLAQNLGELSLIPRNPNDETASAMVEVTIEDILGTRSEKNSRKEEQNRDVSGPPKQSLFDTVVGMMSQAAQERPPFEMTIVQAEEVSTMRFDSRTGVPLQGEQDSYAGARPKTPGSTASYTSDGKIDFSGPLKSTGPPPKPVDFPVPFEGE
ncbi:SAF domain protein [Botrimarina colliarenosi]|uniref:SAF domain protein n=1 Tax=Botrimarina colliarenosi TaxID=2528001 RepID=A0A5C6A7R1_9BACT|nr:Flp pilus assembly protein CpaB [Botrimarina colliarenosi]TWT95974.1 SAF domain protein [Botrimarina colliarenosi]